ncbi:hypothetical protein L1987_13253 [Smallanthus sonchifolius]|uniref:Uncharacterized protein n=1 Tax=Smallanthus sonchifolius TaxID=185202 RepID=A0ACB9JGG2_9ASTR|nr:hypothetical protein L1987_13253 [Smallanthus sonchifolius]
MLMLMLKDRFRDVSASTAEQFFDLLLSDGSNFTMITVHSRRIPILMCICLSVSHSPQTFKHLIWLIKIFSDLWYSLFVCVHFCFGGRALSS